MSLKIVLPGDTIRVLVPVKNAGTVAGVFNLSGGIYYKSGAKVGTLVEVGTGNAIATKTVLPGAVGNFELEKANWANNDPLGFAQGELFDVQFSCQVEGVAVPVTAVDISAIQHDRGYATPPIPAAPTLISTTAQSSTSATIVIGWSSVVANPVVTGWQVWRGGVKVATYGAAVRQHTDVGLVPGMSYSYWVAACNEAGCTNSAAKGIQAAQWLPPIGDAIPKLNMAIMTDNQGEQKTVYPGTSYITVEANNLLTPELRIQNIGEGDGDIQVNLQMLYAGTNIVAATFLDGGNANPIYSFPQGMEIPIIMDDKRMTSDPLGFNDGQMFDLLVTLDAVVGTGYQQLRISNAIRWSRGYAVPPRPASPYLINTVAQSSTSASMTIGWTSVIANPAVTSWEIYRAGVKIATKGAGIRELSMSGLVPDMPYNFYIKACNSIGCTASYTVSIKAAAWVPNIGFAVPRLNMAILTDKDEQRIAYPQGSGYITIHPSDYIMPELRVQNIGEYDGDIKVTFKMVYAGTNTTAATFVDSTQANGTYYIQQGLELPILFDAKNLTADPLGFNDGQMFDLMITLEATVGTGYQQIRVTNCIRWSRT